MNPVEAFHKRNRLFIKKQGADKKIIHKSREWMDSANAFEYSYHFSWLGRPIIQYPQDILAMQEIIWSVKPDLVIETGIAHGGSLIFYASILELIGRGQVLGIDIDIRKHNRAAIESHPLFKRITLIEGSSTNDRVLKQVQNISESKEAVLVCLDSNHTYEHVLQEMMLYSPMVTKNSYMVVFDTIIDDLPENAFPDRPWGKNNNPKVAVKEFLKKNERFKVDREIENKLLITVAPGGYLKCIRN